MKARSILTPMEGKKEMGKAEETQGQADFRAFVHNSSVWAKEGKFEALLSLLFILAAYLLFMLPTYIFVDDPALQIIIAIGLALGIVIFWLIYQFWYLLDMLQWIFRHQTALHDKLIEIQNKEPIVGKT